ncbi:outer membrane beta-barrel protein [Shivajiella indica]|uniref:Outer membrane beta-barrel protein n=1 Tax=Shivajiella indica TaxID=872115 RepID=A0ABW5BCN3_9BACT
MKKLIYITSFLLFVAVSSATAQSYSTFSYSVGIPTSDLGDFISKTSWRGVTYDYRKLVQPNIGVGFTVGWNVFYEEKGSATYTIDNRSLTGKQWRYSNNFPLLVAADYYIKPGEDLNPFVGLGLGTLYTNRTTDMGIYRLERDAWSFAFQPEVGIKYSINYYAGLNLSLKYFYGLQAGDFNGDQSYLAFNIGYVFMGK